MNDREIRRYLTAAEQHLKSARVLAKSGECSRDCVYMAGLAVECALKAQLLSHVPNSQRLSFIETEFKGSGGHSYDRIIELWRQRGGTPPHDWSRHLRRLRSWTVEMRYETARIPSRDALPFLESAARIVNEIEGRLQ